MTHCRICGKPIFFRRRGTSHKGSHQTLCIAKPGTLPGTSCRGIAQRIKRGQKIRPFTLRKILTMVQGGPFLDDDGEIPPILRESY